MPDHRPLITPPEFLAALRNDPADRTLRLAMSDFMGEHPDRYFSYAPAAWRWTAEYDVAPIYVGAGERAVNNFIPDPWLNRWHWMGEFYMRHGELTTASVHFAIISRWVSEDPVKLFEALVTVLGTIPRENWTGVMLPLNRHVKVC